MMPIWLRPLLLIGVLLIAAAAYSAPHKVRVNDPKLARELLARGGRLVADYGGFELVETDEVPPAAGSRAQLADHLNFILLNARPLDTRKPEIQALRQPAGAFAGKRLHLIQFAGPPLPDWVDALAKTGVRVISYIPHNAYLVYGDSQGIAQLQSLARTASFMQWDGQYADEFKIHPQARPVDRKGNPRQIGTGNVRHPTGRGRERQSRHAEAD